MPQIRPLIAGNWKMFGLGSALAEIELLSQELLKVPATTRVAICPAATLIDRVAACARGSAIEVGGQDCHPEMQGAFTGDVSAQMLADAGATLVILGHSERRTLHGETDGEVAQKVLAALLAGLEPIICVGEDEGQRDAGKAVAVVCGQVLASLPDQLAGQAFTVAYEPVWAIGTGRVPSVEQIAEIHGTLRDALTKRFGQQGQGVAILYGGSVKPMNAAEILRVAEVGGALVGGASLKAEDFVQIIRAV